MKKRISAAEFKFQPFSKKQKKVLTWWMSGSPYKDKELIITDGSIRAGKTIAMADGFINWSLHSFRNQNFILAGKSMGALTRNVLNPLKQMLTAKGIEFHHVRSTEEPRLEIGSNVYYLFGANDVSSKDTLQGLTAAGGFADEVALFPENFVNEMINRCSIEGSKLWWNCNPKGPNHFIKTEFIDKAVEKNILRLHFTLDDNLTLSEKIKERYRRIFSGVWYQRYILGLWVLAEGLIYDMFNKDSHLVSDPKEQKKILDNALRFYVSNDYGTGTVFTLGLFAKGADNRDYLVKSFYYDAKKASKQKADSEYAEDLEKFINGFNVSRIIIPDDALSFIRECKNRKIGNIKKFRRDPGTVLDGIRLQANQLTTGKYKIFDVPENKPIIDEYFEYVWDEKAQERGEDKPIKQNDHGKDMERYFHLTVNKGSGVSFLK